MFIHFGNYKIDAEKVEIVAADYDGEYKSIHQIDVSGVSLDTQEYPDTERKINFREFL
jgi:hypothetical protein